MNNTTLNLNTQLQAAQTQATARGTTSQKPTTKEAFQDFVAGTFFKEMFKALRSTESELPYIGGGQAEKIFREQMDTYLSESMAKSHGGMFSDGLYETFQSQLDTRV